MGSSVSSAVRKTSPNRGLRGLLTSHELSELDSFLHCVRSESAVTPQPMLKDCLGRRSSTDSVVSAGSDIFEDMRDKDEPQQQQPQGDANSQRSQESEPQSLSPARPQGLPLPSLSGGRPAPTRRQGMRVSSSSHNIRLAAARPRGAHQPMSSQPQHPTPARHRVRRSSSVVSASAGSRGRRSSSALAGAIVQPWSTSETATTVTATSKSDSSPLSFFGFDAMSDFAPLTPNSSGRMSPSPVPPMNTTTPVASVTSLRACVRAVTLAHPRRPGAKPAAESDLASSVDRSERSTLTLPQRMVLLSPQPPLASPFTV